MKTLPQASVTQKRLYRQRRHQREIAFSYNVITQRPVRHPGKASHGLVLKLRGFLLIVHPISPLTSLHFRQPFRSIQAQHPVIMSGHPSSHLCTQSASSSPLSSPPSTYLSLPSPTPMPRRPRLSSAPLPSLLDPPVEDRQDLGQDSSNIVERINLGPVRVQKSSNSPGQDSAKETAPNSLGLLFPQLQRSRDRGRSGNDADRIPSRIGTGLNQTSVSPCDPTTSGKQLATSSFSSLSSNVNPWPPSPLANKGNKYSSIRVEKRKRVSPVIHAQNQVATGEKLQTKKARWIPPVLGIPPNNEIQHDDTSPDYRMMLNLSDTPSQPDDAQFDPFTQHANLPQHDTNAFHLSTSRDASLSPTIKNSSIGSLESEDLSAVCLAPKETHRSPSYGLFACSGLFSDDQADQEYIDANVQESSESEKRRLSDVMRRWAMGGTLPSTGTNELYRAPEPARPATWAHPSLVLAPPRPIDRNTLALYTRALEDRNRYGSTSGIEASTGLLDIVCETEALMHERNAGMSWPLSSLAPRDMHLQPKQNAAQDFAKRRDWKMIDPLAKTSVDPEL